MLANSPTTVAAVAVAIAETAPCSSWGVALSLLLFDDRVLVCSIDLLRIHISLTSTGQKLSPRRAPRPAAALRDRRGGLWVSKMAGRQTIEVRAAGAADGRSVAVGRAMLVDRSDRDVG